MKITADLLRFETALAVYELGQLRTRPLCDPLQIGDEISIERIVGGPERVERRLACRKEDAEQCDALLSLVGDAVLLPPERRTKTERASNRHFVNMPGHEASAHGWAEVIARTDGYVTVAKIGRRRETLPA